MKVNENQCGQTNQPECNLQESERIIAMQPDVQIAIDHEKDEQTQLRIVEELFE